MQRKQNSEEKIVYALRQVEAGATVAEVTRKMGVSTATFYAWKKRYGGIGVSELRKLKQLVADLSLDKHMLQEVVAKKL